MAFSLISSVQASSSNKDNVTSSSIDTTGSNLIVVHVADYGGTGLGTLSDSKSNTWTPLTGFSQGGGSTSQIYYCYNPTTDAAQTFTYSGSAIYPSIQVMAFSNSASSPFDVENGNGQNFGSTLTTGSVSPSQDNELIVAGCSALSGSPVISSIDSGFNYLLQSTVTANSSAGGFAYLIQTTAGAVNPAWSKTFGAAAAASIATFKAGGAAGPTTGRLASFSCPGFTVG